MANYYLETRKTRVSKLRELAMADRNALKVLQASYLLEQINRRILQNCSLENCYSNLI